MDSNFSVSLKEDLWMETTGHEIGAQNEEALFPRAVQRWKGLSGESMSSHSRPCISKGWRTRGRRYGV